MKKLILLTFIFTAFTMNSQDITWGAKAGLNFSSLDVTDANIDGRTSIHLGVTAEFEMSDVFSIQTELLYSGQGASEDDTESYSFSNVTTTYDDNIKYKLNFIQIPIMAKFYVSDGLSLEAGPQIGFLLSADAESDSSITENGVVISTSSSETDYKEFLKSTDLAFNFGLGYKLDSGLNFGLRYNLGLSDINDVAGSEAKIKNRVLQLSVGYNF